jgi:hypothetical protein
VPLPVHRALSRAFSCHSSDNPVYQDLKFPLKDRTIWDDLISDAKPSVFLLFSVGISRSIRAQQVKETSHELEHHN